MANIYLLAPAPGMSFASLPSGSTYRSDPNGLVVVTNGSVSDQLALAAAGCLTLNTVLTQYPVGAATLSGLYALDTANSYPEGTVGQVFNDSTNTGTWIKTGPGNGSGNWTQESTSTFASLSTAITTETSRAEGAESALASEISAETSRAEAAEASISAGLTNEITNRTASVAAETSRAEAAEAALTAGLGNETARAETAENVLGSSVATLQQQVAGVSINGAYCAGGNPPGTVDCATTAALPNFFYNPLASGDQIVFTSTAPLTTLDGVPVSVGTRILVKNQSGAGQQGALANGLYAMAQQGDGATLPVVLSRVSDAMTAAELGGIKCLVNGGTTNGGTIWVLPQSASSIIVGTTGLNFAEIASGLGTVTSQSGTTYTLQSGDNNSTILFTNSSAVTVTLPNPLPVGFKVKLLQGGAGPVTAQAGSGATLDTPNQAVTGGRYAALDCVVTANAGNAAVWNVIGSAPPNVASVLVSKTANYAATGAEGFIEMNAAGGALVLTVSPTVVSGRAPIRVRKTDATANAVTITDGTNTVFALTSPANALGNQGGWCDVSSNGTNLRTEGVP